MSCVAIIPSAGSGKRFGSEIPKQYIELDGVPVITRTLALLDKMDSVDSIIIAINPGWKEFIQHKNEQFGVKKTCYFTQGGCERQDSVYNALSSEYAGDSDIILVHDAVRPFASPDLINEIIKAAEDYGAAIPGLAPKETIKKADFRGFIVETIERSSLVSVQTPQGFKKNVLLSAYNFAKENKIIATDDASLAEFAGFAVKVVNGEEMNIKITSKFDMEIAEKILLKLI